MLALPAADITRLRYPLLASPKLDGMRVCITQRGVLTRSLRPLPNEKIAAYLDREELRFLDGELIWGDPVADDVVQRSIAAGMSKKGPAPQAGLSYFVFDSFKRPDAPFTERYAMAEAMVAKASLKHVLMVPMFEAQSAEDVLRFEAEILARGFEGVMLRRPNAPYVFGRVKPRAPAILKLKRRSELVGEVVNVVERDGHVAALVVQQPHWRRPFEVPLHGRGRSTPPPSRLIGEKVRFTRLPGSWEGAPQAPLFAAFENRKLNAAFHARKETIMPRELIDTGTDKRYVRRDKKGQFKESDDVGRSLSADRRRKAKTTAKKGEGDKGDRKRK